MSKTNESKVPSKRKAKHVSLRVQKETQKKIEDILMCANKKEFGRKIRADHVLSLAVELLTEDHLKILQKRSMTNEDRMECLRRKYIEVRGEISRDEFYGFVMNPEFLEFINEHSLNANVA